MADLHSEMMALIDAALSAAGLGESTRTISDRLVDRLREEYPELLHKWLDLQAGQVIWDVINRQDRSRRARARVLAARSGFEAAAARYELSHDPAELGDWLNSPFVVADSRRKRLADMTADDLNEVADRYDRSANQQRMVAAFCRAVADKIGDGLVADHFDDVQLASMWRSVTGISNHTS